MTVAEKKSKDNPLSTRIWCFALLECLAFERRMVDVPPIPFSSCYVSGHALSLCSTSSEIPAGWFNLSNGGLHPALGSRVYQVWQNSA